LLKAKDPAWRTQIKRRINMEFTYESVSIIVISAIFLTIGFIIIYFFDV